MKNITICLLCVMGITSFLKAQNVEVDLGIGVHISNINFHHTSGVNSDESSKFRAFDNSNFNIGITSPIGRNHLFLRTEIGFIETNSFFAASYKYNEGYGEQHITRVTYLTNQ